MSNNKGLGLLPPSEMLDGFGAIDCQSGEIDAEAPRMPQDGSEGEAVRFGIPRGESPSWFDSVAGIGILDSSVACAEIGGVLVADFVRYKPTSLYMTRGNVRFALTTSRSGYESLLLDGVPCFVGGELLLLGWGAQNGLIWSSDVDSYIERKLARPKWRLSKASVLGFVKDRCTEALDGFVMADMFYVLDIALQAVRVG